MTGPVIHWSKPRGVLSRWRQTGPLVHIPSCFEVLNSATGGGPVYGSRWYLLGAPDACKTLILLQHAHIWSQLGITVGMLAVDEEDNDLVTRLVQRSTIPGKSENFQRSHCEVRDPGMLDLMDQCLADCDIFLYDDRCTIEDASTHLAETAGGKPSVLMVDSIQTAQCKAVRSATKEQSLREVVSHNVRAIRACSTERGQLIMCTSEMNRMAYRSIQKIEQDDMAAAKESGAIEYSARVMLALRATKEEPDCIECRVIKNKHGRSYPHQDAFYLAVDRPRQSLCEREAPEGGPDLKETLVGLISSAPGTLTTSALRERLKVNKTVMIDTLNQARDEGLIRRLNGERSAWAPMGYSSTDED